MAASFNMVRDTRKPLAASPSAGNSPSPKPMPSRPIAKPSVVTFKPATFKYPATVRTSIVEVENIAPGVAHQVIKPEVPPTPPARAPAAVITPPTPATFFGPAAAAASPPPFIFGRVNAESPGTPSRESAENAKMPTGGGLQTSMFSSPTAAAPVPGSAAKVANVPFAAAANSNNRIKAPLEAASNVNVAQFPTEAGNIHATTTHVPFAAHARNGHVSFGAKDNHTVAAPATVVNATPLLNRTAIDAHKLLLSNQHAGDGGNVADEVTGAPIFVDAVRRYAQPLSDPSRTPPFSQYGLLGGDLRGVSLPGHTGWADGADPRIFYNISAPSSVFICGSQGSGKSHTLGCLLENCLVPSEANTLPRPLTGLVFHYDSFVSDTAGSPCEAAYLSSKAGVKVRVLCSPTNTAQIRRIYSKLPNVVIEELRINEADLNTQRMLDLMAVNSHAAHAMPLYMSVINRILRELRIEQQANNTPFNYGKFKLGINKAALTEAQLAPLQQRLETLESFMVQKQALAYDLFKTRTVAAKTSATRGNDWTAQSGRLTIVDLSCPCITAEMACSLFGICLSLFLEQPTQVGRVVALDEAHKFMTNTAECASLTESLLSTIRLQRHLGARVIISTQEPTISPRLLDLCSVTIVHRFTSPDWLATLKQHLAGASACMDAINESKRADEAEDQHAGVAHPQQPLYTGIQPLSIKTANVASGLFREIVSLNTGEALMFAPNAVIGMTQKTAAPDATSLDRNQQQHRQPSNRMVPERLGPGVLKVIIRKRVTQDGGRSIMAG